MFNSCSNRGEPVGHRDDEIIACTTLLICITFIFFCLPTVRSMSFHVDHLGNKHSIIGETKVRFSSIRVSVRQEGVCDNHYKRRYADTEVTQEYVPTILPLF